jgi:hypothetical protein
MRSIGSSYVNKGRLRAFLKKPSVKASWWTAQSEQKPAKNGDTAVNRTLPFKRHLPNLGLVNSPECERCKQVSEMASHILCDWNAFATLRFRHLSHHFMKQGDFEEISVSKILHFVQGAGLLNEWDKGLHKRLIMVEMHRSLGCLPLRILFYVDW